MNFGRALRDDFLLDPGLVYLNHGTVGVTHRAVLAAQRAMVDEIERNPARFLLRELTDAGGPIDGEPRIRRAAAEVAPFVGADAGDFVFVDNITTGANAVLRSLELAAGDEILVTDLGYGGITNAAQFAATRAGATLATVAMPWPATDPSEYAAAVAAALTPRTRVLVVDHLTAQTALVLPISDIVDECHWAGVQVLVDGAHVPGNIALDVPSVGSDWYVANLHKWAFAPRSCGFLWAAPPAQKQIHSLVVSWGYGQGFTREFDLPGTRDPSPMLCAPTAIEVLRGYGLDDVFRHNHDLAWWAGQYLSDRFGTPFTTPESMIGAMVTVRLPHTLGSERDDATRTMRALNDRGIEVPVFATHGSLWARVSAQIYVDRADIEALGAAVGDVAGPIRSTGPARTR